MADDNKHITEIVNNSFWFETMHDNAASQYATTNVVGSLQSLNVRGAGGGGLGRIIIVANRQAQKFPIRIHFFRRRPSVFTDGVLYAPLWNDILKFARWVDIPAGLYTTYGNIEVAQLVAPNIDFSCPDGFLYYYVEAQGAATFTVANELMINFGDWPD